MAEHQADVRRFNQKSHVAEHVHKFDHRFAFNEARIIDYGRFEQYRLVKEAWHSDATCINRHIDLDPAYKALRYRLERRIERQHRPSDNQPRLNRVHQANATDEAQLNVSPVQSPAPSSDDGS